MGREPGRSRCGVSRQTAAVLNLMVSRLERRTMTARQCLRERDHVVNAGPAGSVVVATLLWKLGCEYRSRPDGPMAGAACAPATETVLAARSIEQATRRT